MITVEIHNSAKPNQVIIVAKQNGKQLLKSPMQCKSFDKKQIEKQVRKDLKVYDTPLYGGLSIIFMFKVEQYDQNNPR